MNDQRWMAEVGVRAAGLAELVSVPEPAAERLERWLAQIADPSDLGLDITVAMDEDRVVFELSGPRRTIEANLTEFATAAGIDDERLAELEQVCEWQSPERLASWFEITRTGIDLGWTLNEAVELVGVWPLTSPDPCRDELRAALDDLGVDTASWVMRSMGSAANLTALGVALPGADVVAQARLGRDLIDALEVEPLPLPLLQGLVSLSAGPAELRVWLADGGVARAGIAVPNPGSDLLLMLRHELGIDDPQSLAATEAVLGANDRAWVEVVRGAGGVSVEATYRLNSQTPAGSRGDA